MIRRGLLDISNTPGKKKVTVTKATVQPLVQQELDIEVYSKPMPAMQDDYGVDVQAMVEHFKKEDDNKQKAEKVEDEAEYEMVAVELSFDIVDDPQVVDFESVAPYVF